MTAVLDERLEAELTPRCALCPGLATHLLQVTCRCCGDTQDHLVCTRHAVAAALAAMGDGAKTGMRAEKLDRR